MTLIDIKKNVTSLTKAEKLELIRFLSVNMLKEEYELFDPDESYVVWSPYNEYRAANQLQTFIHLWNK